MTFYSNSQKTRMLIFGYFALPILLLAMVIPAVPLVVIYGLEPPIIGLLLATVAGELLFIAAMLFAAGVWRLEYLVDVLGLQRENVSLKKLGIGALFGLLYFAVLQAFSFGFGAMGIDLASSDTSSLLGSSEGFAKIVVLLLLVPIVVPIVEEIIFRGIIFGFLLRGHDLDEIRVRENKRLLSPVLVSSIFFALIHIQGWSQFSDFFLLAWIFVVAVGNALLRLRTESLWVPIMAHCVYNGISAIGLFLALGGS